MNRYWSDLHLDHRGIVGLCQRPFTSLEEMTLALLEEWLSNLEILGRGEHHVYCLGDVALNLGRFPDRGGEPIRGYLEKDLPKFREYNHLISGNHDSGSQELRERIFGEIVGTHKTWETNTLIVEDEYRTMEGTVHPVKLLLSHKPQRDLQGCDYNLFGHIHNMLLRKPELIYSDFQWMYPDSPDSPWINVSVELIGYKPRSFQELYQMRKHMGLRLL